MTIYELVGELLAAGGVAGGVVGDEVMLQNRISEALPHLTREKRFGRDRIDFFDEDGAIGIEVKIKGGAIPLVRQLRRYLDHTEVTGLILVTTSKRLGSAVPTRLGGKPVAVVYLATFM